ncbi:MAG: competence/damage-inducible protein A [Chitinophagaceae bacterium]|jgi:nicotinamide-nucleotide amidase|nr:competence/damage-inducible protein A [Chitinophagaceae bacterium]
MIQTTNASIITIGDELLIGQVVDTNSAWMAQELNKTGIAVKHRIAVGDVWKDIWDILDEECKYADIILITGGLGPTADDITKPLLCEYFAGKLVIHQPTLEHIAYLHENFFKRLLTINDRNYKQAEVPDNCTVIKNEVGTAPGMWFEKDGQIFVSMPGVPHEMKTMMSRYVLPKLQQTFLLSRIAHRTLLTAGIGESALAERIKDFENNLPPDIKLAYLPNYGMVRLRLTATGNEENNDMETALNKRFEELQSLIKDVVVANEDIPFEEAIGRLLVKYNKTISTAESCTGGYIAHLLTAIPGASAYFIGSVVSYANQVKTNILGVNNSVLDTAGAVSEACVREMVSGAIGLLKTDYAIAVSGILGPSGGTPEKPVGTVWIAVSNGSKTYTQKFHFRYDRLRNMHLIVTQAFIMLRKIIVEDNEA